MFRFHLSVAAACLAALFLTAPAVHADPFLPVPPASFLNYHVDTVRQLTEQVQLDEMVRGRLARHFHMTQPQITSYIQDNLVVAHLPEAGRYRVACVTSSGREYWISERLSAGTPVFALRGTNQPILRLVCGNPLVKTLPVVQKSAPVRPAELINTPAHSVPPAVPPATPETVTFAPDGTLIGPGAATLGPLVRVAGMTQTLGGGHDGSLLPLFGLLPFLPFGGGHSSSSSVPISPLKPVISNPVTPSPGTPTTPTIPTTPTSPSPVPAPEPSPDLFFAVAGVALIALRVQGAYNQK